MPQRESQRSATQSFLFIYVLRSVSIYMTQQSRTVFSDFGLAYQAQLVEHHADIRGGQGFESRRSPDLFSSPIT